MAGGKEIRTKIKSVKNTQKITKAMEMVAASKMRRAQERMRASRPYGERVRTIIGNLAYANTEYRHPYLIRREPVKRVGIIVVTSDKGLCGGLNTNILRLALNRIKELQAAGVDVKVTCVGNKGLGFMQRMNAKVVSHVIALGDTPHLEKLIGPVKVMLDAYESGELDEVLLGYTQFVNTMKQEAVLEQLLPLKREELEASTKHAWDYIYEPGAKEVIDELMVRYAEALIYQAVAENMASEQSARMVAMKSASDNAGNVIDELQMIYNKTRQAAITKEISEIVAGAAAV
jgi:F-type H+-transporting ATPase subunit gamma